MAKKTNTDTGRLAAGVQPLTGTGVPTEVNDENLPNDKRLTEEYTRNDEELKEGVREMNPNRNPDKPYTGGH